MLKASGMYRSSRRLCGQGRRRHEEGVVDDISFEIALDGGEAQHRARDSRAQGRRQGDRRRRRENVCVPHVCGSASCIKTNGNAHHTTHSGVENDRQPLHLPSLQPVPVFLVVHVTSSRC